MSLSVPLPRDPRPHRRIRASLRAGVVWALAAAGVNVGIWLCASAFGVPFWLQLEAGATTEIGPLAIVGATIFAGLVASLAVGVLAKLVKKVVRWIILLGIIFTAASLAAPWQQPAEVPASTRIILTVMHLVTGAAVTFALARGIWTDDRAVRL